MSNKQPQMHFTPKGRTHWLKVFKPDTKFDTDGFYGGKLILDDADAQDIMADLDAAFEKAIAAATKETGKPRAKIRTTAPYEIDQETGDVSLKFKLKAKITTKNGDSFTQKPRVVDAKTVPITSEIPLWNNSLVRVGFQIIPYYTSLAGAGLSLRMKSVQVLEALAGADTSTSDFISEDGYVYKEEQGGLNSWPDTTEDCADDVAF